MFSISIALGRGTPVVWTLMFRQQEAADAALATLQNKAGDISVTDQFGQTFSGEKGNIVGVLFEDLEQSRVAHVDRIVHDQKIRASAISRMQADPALKATMLGQGPAVLSPMGFNGRG